MIQWVKHLLGMHEDLSFITSAHAMVLHAMVLTCNPTLGQQRQEHPCHLLASCSR